MKELQTKAADKNIMNAHARGYTDQQLWELSVYFSQLNGRQSSKENEDD
jgi:cytochrome c553